MADQPASLRGLLDSLASEAGDVTTEESAGEHHYSRGGRAFAVANDRGLELRLDPEIAEAAARTPDTTASSRGTGWVSFAPATLDGHAIDRAKAWFLSAWRAAQGRSRQTLS